MPGLTRDRREGERELGGQPVTLVDTAGLEEAAPARSRRACAQQTETAIAEADLVLFVIDARAGVTPADKAFAALPRASGKPVILVANKCEGRAGSDGFYEAFELGLGEPVADLRRARRRPRRPRGRDAGRRSVSSQPVAAERRRRRECGDRTRRQAATPIGTRRATDSEDDLTPAAPIRVAIVGRPNAGKSTLVNAHPRRGAHDHRPGAGPHPRRHRHRPRLAAAARSGCSTPPGSGARRAITELAEKLAASDAIRAISFAEVVVLLIDAEPPARAAGPAHRRTW